ncbi:VIT1/CCC1 transporter family protein [Pontibacter russatus]|uniref:VIT1/CCC1 transporter family protein n=1 Tax=Pontibacter russatus TaxID=2694929 RepID=UPI00137A322D|nr:VIT1/CCC1 transporter family protein [Pontibacter russatus]
MAGLLVVALPMALGEWISVKSSQEQYKRLRALEMLEIETTPEGEMRGLALIYMAQGIPGAQAHHVAAATIQDTEHPHKILMKEEPGTNTEEWKGSAWEAALRKWLQLTGQDAESASGDFSPRSFCCWPTK